ncbi:MAG: hypothetical protein ABIZ80_16990, partial [Bryobacteraceae bacterium]
VPTMSLDWCATFREAARVSKAPRNSLDGISLMPLLRGEKGSAARTFHWTFEDSLVGTPRSFACRRGKWKMLRVGTQMALYDLDRDAGEEHDESAAHPEVLQRLVRDSAAWAATLPS